MFATTIFRSRQIDDMLSESPSPPSLLSDMIPGIVITLGIALGVQGISSNSPEAKSKKFPHDLDPMTINRITNFLEVARPG